MHHKPNITQEEKLTRMTESPLPGLIFSLAVPTIVSMLISALYNMADTYFVGLIGNASATGAIGVVFPLMSLMQAIAFMFGHGSGNHMSRSLGAGDVADAEKYASTGFFSALGAGVLLMMIGLIAGLIPMFFCLLMALAALLRVGGAMLLGFGALYLLPMTAVYVYCLLRRQPFWHSCAALALALSGALTVIYALVQGMTGGQLYAAAGDAVMQSLDGLAMRDSLLYTLHQMGLLSLPQAMRETALVAVEGGYAFSAEAAQELTLQCRTLVMSLLHGLLPALLVSGTATNVLTGMGLGIYFGRRAAQKRAFKRDEPEQDIPDLGMPELRYWHIPRPWGLRIGILAVGYLIMRLPVGDTLYLLGALMWQAFCVCFAVQGLAAINFNQHQRGTRKGWRVAAIIAAMTVSLFQSVLMIIGVFDQINNARGLRPALKPRDGGEE